MAIVKGTCAVFRLAKGMSSTLIRTNVYKGKTDLHVLCSLRVFVRIRVHMHAHHSRSKHSYLDVQPVFYRWHITEILLW
jgi:hypothetical protein